MSGLPQHLGLEIVLEKGIELSVVGRPDLRCFHRGFLHTLLQLVRAENVAFLGFGREDVVPIRHWNRIGTVEGLTRNLCWHHSECAWEQDALRYLNTETH